MLNNTTYISWGEVSGSQTSEVADESGRGQISHVRFTHGGQEGGDLSNLRVIEGGRVLEVGHLFHSLTKRQSLKYDISYELVHDDHR